MPSIRVYKDTKQYFKKMSNNQMTLIHAHGSPTGRIYEKLTGFVNRSQRTSGKFMFLLPGMIVNFSRTDNCLVKSLI